LDAAAICTLEQINSTEHIRAMCACLTYPIPLDARSRLTPPHLWQDRRPREMPSALHRRLASRQLYGTDRSTAQPMHGPR
jgi:hypothetical protein